MSLPHATTQLLDIVYQEGAPSHARVVLLLHGWPDDIRAWHGVAPRYAQSQHRLEQVETLETPTLMIQGGG
jgi:pimeloyl-ACP methyl ester carboxylesterase